MTRRRYVLGCQGLWPGRQAAGISGVGEAIRRSEAIQVDPLNVIARSHDLALHARVDGYQREYLDQLLYRDREFFDYGGVVYIYPMHELPYWRVHMHRRKSDKRWSGFAEQQQRLILDVLQRTQESGAVSARDFAGSNKARSFRSSKDTSKALYYLWLTGELMTHSRRNFERLFSYRHDVVPRQYDYIAAVDAAEAYFARKALSFEGLPTGRTWATRFSNFIHRKVDRNEAKALLADLVGSQRVAAVRVEGSPEVHYIQTEKLPILEELEAGKVPARWSQVAVGTTREATLLAPLDIVSARGRALSLFDFEYLWEVYKPAERRRWGYYTMPVLYGDRLVARLDPKYDRTTQSLVIKGLWLEDSVTTNDEQFADSLAAGISRLAAFVGARGLDVSAIEPRTFRNRLRAGSTF